LRRVLHAHSPPQAPRRHPPPFREIEAGYRAQAAVLCSASLHRENVRAAIDSIATETPVLITAEIESMGSMLDGTLPEAFLDFARAVPGVAGCH
jgi:hypothetical protein